ncbi:MAG: hypothetical protein C5B47_03340 [Verrucomicrobia bacterium]|nr:MAG: hypothetical protein C5B47_03340 [Verrucomicrobiota bacterium]
MKSKLETISLLGIPFFSADFEQGIRTLTQQAGLVVFPSGPNLARNLWEDVDYCLALQNADIAFADSGAMVLLWRIFSGQKIPRYSGFKMLTEMLIQPDFHKQGATFWVMPSLAQRDANLRWLNQKLSILEEDCYCAPGYGPGSIEDPILLEILKKKRPQFVILCLGGGVQERLGYFLRNHLGKTTSILCTGAAIGFLSGVQVRIPRWADAIFLGWFFRCLSSPNTFLPRYFKALNLIKVIFLYWLYGRVPNLVKKEANQDNEVY